MKKIVFSLFFSLLFAILNATSYTIATLRAVVAVANTVYTTTDYGGGNWSLAIGDVSSFDNTGTVIVTNSGQRLKRAFTGNINMLWFGLNGDGTDETVKVQNALNAATGHTIIVPVGTFSTGKVGVSSNTIIIGSVGSKFKMVQGTLDNIMISVWSVSNVDISGIELDLTGITGNIYDGTAAVQIQGSTNVRIHSCYIHDNTYVGIRLTGNNTGVSVDHNFIKNTDTGVHCNNLNTNVTVEKNFIYGGTSEGITVYGYSYALEPYGFVIDSNTIIHKDGSFGINIPFAKLCTISNNNIDSCWGGILLHDVVSTGIEALYTSRIVINNNNIGTVGFGIEFVGDSTRITNNLITGVRQDGININNFTVATIYTTGDTISNNIIVAPGVSGGGRGGISFKNLTNSIISNNFIMKCLSQFAIRMDGGCSNLTITGNKQDGVVQLLSGVTIN